MIVAAIVPEAPGRIRLSDIEAGNVLIETTIKAGRVASAKRYFIPVHVEVWQSSDSVFRHDDSARDRNVHTQLSATRSAGFLTQ